LKACCCAETLVVAMRRHGNHRNATVRGATRARISASNSNPFRPGMLRSERTTSGPIFRTNRNPAKAFLAAKTCAPRPARDLAINRRTPELSSMRTILAFWRNGWLTAIPWEHASVSEFGLTGPNGRNLRKPCNLGFHRPSNGPRPFNLILICVSLG
jgi:hypothetical protein